MANVTDLDVENLLALVANKAKNKAQGKVSVKGKGKGRVKSGPKGYIVAQETGKGWFLFKNEVSPTASGIRINPKDGIMTEFYATSLGKQIAADKNMTYVELRLPEVVDSMLAENSARFLDCCLPEDNTEVTLTELEGASDEQKYKLAVAFVKPFTGLLKSGCNGDNWVNYMASLLGRAYSKPFVMFCVKVLEWADKNYGNNDKFKEECKFDIFPQASFTLPAKPTSPKLGFAVELAARLRPAGV